MLAMHMHTGKNYTGTRTGCLSPSLTLFLSCAILGEESRGRAYMLACPQASMWSRSFNREAS